MMLALKFSFLFFIYGLDLSPHTTSEPYEVSGQVTAFLEIPLTGVQVLVKKTDKTIKTDASGHFDLTLNRSDMLIIKADGFQPFKIRISKQTSLPLQINLILDESHADQAIESGYLTSEQYEYAKKHLYNKNNKFAQYSDIYELLQRELPGVRIIRSGAPGGGAQVQLTGVNTISLDPNPVFVVDGMIVEDISFIAPFMIVRVNVLKEASIYGSRGANGAIEIFTTENE
ncbi:MAG: TonB-dependent receptor plug domain-containing protein [Cyclobacteriaceae bacterium]